MACEGLITPFFGNDDYRRLSPLRRIPILIDGDAFRTDSSVILAYLDDAYPQCPLVRRTPVERARARWFEEYADTRLGDLFVWSLFYQRIVRPLGWGEPGDEARAEHALTTLIPEAMAYLEDLLPEAGFLIDEDLSVGDSALGSMFGNAAMAGFTADQWPRVDGYVRGVLDTPPFVKLRRFEYIQHSVAIQGRRQALRDAGARLTEETFAQREPRRGVVPLQCWVPAIQCSNRVFNERREGMNPSSSAGPGSSAPITWS